MHVEMTSGQELRLSRALFVCATATGLRWARRGGRAGAVSLQPLDLLVLESLAHHQPFRTEEAVQRVAAELLIEAGEVEGLFDQLAAADLLRPDDAAAPSGRSPVPLSELVTSGPADIEWDAPLVLDTPVVLRLGARAFEHTTEDDTRTTALTARELAVASAFTGPTLPANAWSAHQAKLGHRALDRQGFDAVVEALVQGRYLRAPRAPGVGRQPRAAPSQGRVAAIAMMLKHAVDRSLDRQQLTDGDLAELDRWPVVPIHRQGDTMPLALGLVFSHARAAEADEGAFRLVPDWVAATRRFEWTRQRPGIFLFSNYVWTHEACLRVARRLKRLNPVNITVHGGPDTPNYPLDVRNYFARNPAVDVVVHGEGEETALAVLRALAGLSVSDVALGGSGALAAALADVPGVSVRDGDRVLTTEARPRMADLDVVPSPYLTGLFDAYRELPGFSATVETNRGCPYGCTFCDWGGATRSRIRHLDEQRVLDDLEWCARAGIEVITFADANFGIWDRDVRFAEHIAQLKAVHGFPVQCRASYAKNTNKHLARIVKIWADAGIVSHGLVSLQTVDDATLQVVNRSNIRVDRYEQLAKDLRGAGLPLVFELMMGLPGSTVDSFRADLQNMVDREAVAQIHPTTLLRNSPMNEPGYKREHAIRIAGTGDDLLFGDDLAVVATATFDQDDYAEMVRLRRLFMLCENCGVLRQVGRYARQEVGIPEMDFYRRLHADAIADPDRWPALFFTLECGPDLLAPPSSWRLLIEELREHLIHVDGVPDDPALETVLTVQHALLPTRARHYPVSRSLAHGFAHWHHAIVAAKEEGLDWPSVVTPLREHPPETFSVDDPQSVSTEALGEDIEHAYFDHWELASPVARPMMRRAEAQRA